MNVIACNGLSKSFKLGFRGRRVQAVQDLQFSLAQGEVLGLVGPNGSGKSTTIKLLLGLLKPDSGTGTLFGKLPSDPTSRANVGYLPESPVPFEYLSGRQYLELQGRLARLAPAALGAAIDEVLALVEMSAHQKHAIRSYSKGMVQRITLAGALLGKPELLILDEPTSGLDPLGRGLVRDLIRSQRKAGVSVLFCTHILSDVENLCDRVVMLVGGKLRRAGTVTSLLGGDTTYEVALEGASAAFITPPGAELLGHTGERSSYAVAATELQAFVRAALAADLKIALVAPRRLSLEESLVSELKAETSVGGAIQ